MVAAGSCRCFVRTCHRNRDTGGRPDIPAGGAACSGPSGGGGARSGDGRGVRPSETRADIGAGWSMRRAHRNLRRDTKYAEKLSHLATQRRTSGVGLLYALNEGLFWESLGTAVGMWRRTLLLKGLSKRDLLLPGWAPPLDGRETVGDTKGWRDGR